MISGFAIEFMSFYSYLMQTGVLEAKQPYREFDGIEKNTVLKAQMLKDKLVTEKTLAYLYEQYEQTPYEEGLDQSISKELIQKISEKIVRRFHVFPLSERDGKVILAMRNPYDYDALEKIFSITNLPLLPVIVRSENIERLINEHYRKVDKILALSKRLAKEIETAQKDNAILNMGGATLTESSITHLLDLLLEEGLNLKASDLHLESDEHLLRVRLRIDGELFEEILPYGNIAEGLFQRLRIMSHLDITQSNVPQNGQLVYYRKGEPIGARISFLPLVAGTSVVMRFFSTSSDYDSLEKTVHDPGALRALQAFLNRTQGMILVTGPTGSGKTTTLYSSLATINQPSKKIITIEDPVEIRMPRLVQVEVHPDQGLDFDDVLSTCLRQDPDVIMLGEIRNGSTAGIGMRAAITGHLVLSTLHTNGVIPTINRLLDLDIDPFLLASAARLVVSQRLLKKNCDKCLERESLDEQESYMFAKLFPDKSLDDYKFKRGKGCNYCKQQGYLGRLAVFEVLEIDNEMVVLIGKGDVPGFTAYASEYLKGKRMLDKAFHYAEQGLVPITAVLALSGDD